MTNVVNVIENKTFVKPRDKQVVVVREKVVEVVTLGVQGADGVPGAAGAQGVAGQGVPTGGNTGQVLAKNSNVNYDTEWVDVEAGGQSVGAVGSIQFAGASNTFDSDEDRLTWNQGDLLFKAESNSLFKKPTAVVANPTGTLTATPINIGSGSYNNGGFNHQYRLYTYKIIEGETVYSSAFLTASYSDDAGAGVPEDIELAFDNPMPSGIDGYRIFKFDDYHPHNFEVYLNSLIDNGTFTAGAAISGNPIFHSTFEDLAVKYKVSGSEFYYFNPTNKRIGIGTNSPSQRLHVKGETVTVPNPTGSMSINEVTGYADPYENNGTTHTYRAYAFAIIDGIVVYSLGYVQESYTDDGSGGNFYSLSISPALSYSGIAVGIHVFKVGAGGYFLEEEIIDGGDSVFTAGAVTATTFPHTALIEDAYFEIQKAGVSLQRFDTDSGGWEYLKICNRRNPGQTLLVIDGASGQSADLLQLKVNNGVSFIRVGASGQITATAGILLSGTSTFSGTNTFSGANTFTGTTNIANDLRMTKAGSNRIFFGNVGVQVPTANGIGQKIQLYGNTLGTVGLADYAVGVESGFLWFTSGGGYKFYNSAGLATITMGGTGTITCSSDIATSGNFRATAFGTYFGVLNGPRFTCNNGNNGIIFFGTGAAENILNIRLAASQTGAAFRVQNSSSATQLSIAANGRDFILDTTTGTKWGTATTQKQSFWNATPLVQPTTSVAAAAFVMNTSGILNDTATFDGYTIGQIVKALRNMGLLA